MADDCTPEARITKSLLGYGVLAGIVYVAGSVIQGGAHVRLRLRAGQLESAVARPVGLDPHHGVRADRGDGRRGGRRLPAARADGRGTRLVVYGALLVVAGFALPDAKGAGFTAHGLVHLAAGGLGFIAFAVAAFSTARRFGREGARGWAAFSIVAGVLLLLGFVGVASGSSSAAVVLGFTATVLLSWVWLALASIRTYRQADAVGRAEARQRVGV